MMWRLNFLVIFCCVVLQNSYMLYYICPMHTIFTVFVYACLGIAPHLNKTPAWMWTKWVGRAGDELGATAAATKPAATAHSVRRLLHLPCASHQQRHHCLWWTALNNIQCLVSWGVCRCAGARAYELDRKLLTVVPCLPACLAAGLGCALWPSLCCGT